MTEILLHKQRPGRLPRLFGALLFVFSGTIALLSAEETPTGSFGVPRWGTSVRLPLYSLNAIPMTLINPREEAFEFLINVSPDQVGEATIINQRLLNLGPGAQLRAQSRFLSYATQSYTADLIDNRRGIRLERATVNSAHETQAIRKRIFVINDTDDFRVAGEMIRLNILSSRIQLTRSRAEDAPRYWSEYGPVSIILFAQPDFSAMNDLQFQAVRDFVIGGGTVVFAHPDTIMAAKNTPLEDLLPVEPIAARKVEQLPSLERWFAPYRKSPAAAEEGRLHWPEGLALLESEPRNDAHVVLSHRHYPLIAWQQAGTGMIGVFTFDTTDDSFLLSRNGLPLWNHVLSWTHPHPMTTGTAFAPPLERAAERLTGFHAAGADTVQLILAGNFVFLVLVLVLARVTRRQTTGWLILGTYGIVMTTIIFLAAYGQMKEQPNRNTIVLDIMHRQDDRQVGLQSVSLFSRHDTIPEIETTLPAAAFVSVVAPNIDLNPLAMFNQRPLDSLQIRRQGRSEELRNFNLSALRRRSFGCAYTINYPQSEASETTVSRPSAVLHYRRDGLRVSGLNLPPELPDNTIVYLTGGNGAQLLQPTETGEWRVEADRTRVFQLNPVLTRIEEFIAGNWLPPNRLLFLYPSRQAPDQAAYSIRDDENYATNKYTFQLVPVREQSDEGDIAVAAPMIEIRPADRLAQTLLWQEEGSYLTTGGSYLFTAHLPPFLAALKLDTVTVDVRIQDQEGTAVAEVDLLPFAFIDPKSDETSPNGNFVEGVESQPGRFVFNTSDIIDMTDPVTGRFYLRLRVAARGQAERELPVAGRSLFWRLLELRASARGTYHHPQQTDDGV